MELDNNFKHYVLEYRNGNTDILEKFILYKKQYYRIGSHKGYETVFYPNDYVLNSYLNSCLRQYEVLNPGDVREIFLEGLSKAIKTTELDKTSGQMLSFAKKYIENMLMNELTKRLGIMKDNDPKSPTYGQRIPQGVLVGHTTKNPEDGSEIDIFETVSYSQYQTLDTTESQQKKFLHIFDENAKDILSDKQYQVYQLMKETPEITNREIGEKLKQAEKRVSRKRNAIKNKFLKMYEDYERLKENLHTPVTKKIIEVLNTYDTIVQFDGGNFDYFNFFFKFLKDNYVKGEQEISFEQLHKNKRDYTYSVFDVLVDYMSYVGKVQALQDMLDNGYNPIDNNNFYINSKGEKKYWRTYDKENCVKHIIKAFNKYLHKQEKSLLRMIQYIHLSENNNNNN